jgi:hypothetical protein
MAVWIKQGVYGSLEVPAHHGFRRVEKLYEQEKKEMYVTSIREGTHMPGTLHHIGYAWDQGVNGVSLEKVTNAVGKDFDVVLFGNRKFYHIEFDPKRRK